MLWRKLLLMTVVLGGVAITAWIWEDLPEPNAIVFDLTAMEIKTDSGPLRHPDAKRLVCVIYDDKGATMATIEHRLTAPVTHESIIEVSPGEYDFRITVHFQRPQEAPREHTITRQATLDGEPTRIRL